MITNKWDDSLYIMDQDIEKYYNDRKEATTLFILGKGFDPRMCVGIEKLAKVLHKLKVVLLEYDEGPNSSSQQYFELTQQNYERLIKITEIVSHKLSLQETILPTYFKEIFPLEKIEDYQRIIIDISAMPYSISFNLIKHYENATQNNIKIDILVCDNSTFDDAIKPTGLAESANYLSGFNVFSMSMESEDDAISIWLPLLSENCKEELEKIYPFVTPNEICPVLPFPSVNPRKSDKILLYLGEQLFSSYDIDRKNIIYVSENNVKQVYRKICSVVEYYNDALTLIKASQVKFIISTAASKLISLGALLATLDISKRKISISFVLVNNDGYSFEIKNYKSENNKLHCICLNENIYEW